MSIELLPPPEEDLAAPDGAAVGEGEAVPLLILGALDAVGDRGIVGGDGAMDMAGEGAIVGVADIEGGFVMAGFIVGVAADGGRFGVDVVGTFVPMVGDRVVIVVGARDMSPQDVTLRILLLFVLGKHTEFP
mmetsp:Transcript_4069/g.10253  ORF Transcript_4069/g.10253 Transcript_4069/m.10253 type:complete len:132 (+) Transcript_4069:404-799(+)